MAREHLAPFVWEAGDGRKHSEMQDRYELQQLLLNPPEQCNWPQTKQQSLMAVTMSVLLTSTCVTSRKSQSRERSHTSTSE